MVIEDMSITILLTFLKMKNKPYGYWTKEKCIEESLKCETRAEFKKNYNTAYNITYKNNWVDEVFYHMKPSRNKTNYWTKEKCAKEALKYKYKKDFIINSATAYNKSVKNNWLDEITKHMNRPFNIMLIWTKEKCAEEALKYKYRIDFQNNSGSAYVTSCENNWLDDICKHMSRPINWNKKWTKETCRIEALKHKKRHEFSKKSSRAYQVSIELGILDDICSHMETCGSLMLRSIYAYEFSDNYVYVGLTYNTDLRHKQHLTSERSSVYKHIKATGLIPEYKILTKYIDVYEAMKLEEQVLNDYMQDNWIKLNKSRTGGIGWIKLPEKQKFNQ